MITLLIVIAAGILLAFFSGQNSLPVTLHVGGYVFPNIPMYIVILGSFFLGVFIAWILSAFGWANHAMRLMGKDKLINKYQQTTASLQNRVRQLELENAKLNNDKKEITHEKDREIKDIRQEKHVGVLDTLREKINPSV